ncbi:hypothetical protein Hanom_Chr08g00692841 [Helianthus anomalus]
MDPESFCLGMLTEMTFCCLHAMPFHEQGVSSDWFQLVKDPCGSCVIDCLNFRRVEPSLFKQVMWIMKWELHRIRKIERTKTGSIVSRKWPKSMNLSNFGGFDWV